MVADVARKMLVIRNPVAGCRDPRLLDGVLDRLARAGIDVVVRDTARAGDARVLAAMPGDANMVVAAGGDGTVDEVVDGLMSADTRPSLAILPLGTANVLAHEIALAARVADVVDAILDGRPLPVFPGRVAWSGGTRHFALMVGAGFDAHVVKGVGSVLKRRLGKGAYVWRSLVEMARYRGMRYAVEIDGVRHDAASVIVSKARHYAGPYVAAPNASLSEPILSVCLFERDGRWAIVRYGLALVANRLPSTAGYRVIDGVRRVRIVAMPGDGKRREPFQIDGDVGGDLPVDMDVATTPLTLMVPRARR